MYVYAHLCVYVCVYVYASTLDVIVTCQQHDMDQDILGFCLLLLLEVPWA